MAQIYPQKEGTANAGGRPGLNVDFVAVCDGRPRGKDGERKDHDRCGRALRSIPRVALEMVLPGAPRGRVMDQVVWDGPIILAMMDLLAVGKGVANWQ